MDYIAQFRVMNPRQENIRNSAFCGQKNMKKFHDAMKNIHDQKSSGVLESPHCSLR